MAAEPRTFRHELRSDAPLVVPSRYARARLARAETIAGAVAAVFNCLRALAVRVAEWRRDARARRELAALSDRDLADMGLTRSDLHRKDLSAPGRERAEPRASAPVTAIEPANRSDAKPQAA